MKGAIQGKHIGRNNYVFSVIGLPDLTCVKFKGLEQEIEDVDLPDRTKASGGQTKASTIEFAIPMHHDTEVNAMENWHREAKDPVSATYKKTGTLVLKDIEGTIRRTWTVVGVWPKKRSFEDLELENEGQMQVVTWMCDVDDIIMTQ